MHSHAHGNVPTTIIEVSPSVVESFMGKLKDPDPEQNDNELIIPEPGLRVLAVVRFRNLSLNKADFEKSVNFKRTLPGKAPKYKGKIVTHNTDGLLISFTTASDALRFAMEIRSEFIKSNEGGTLPMEIQTGLDVGIPVESEGEIFQKVIETAQKLSHISGGDITLSAEVKILADNENFVFPPGNAGLQVLYPPELEFLNRFMKFMESSWFENDLKTGDFTKSLGISETQLYRKVTSLTGKGLSRFLKEYRLEKALIALNTQKDNISRIAFENGFNSLAYFSKCFEEAYGIRPSAYLKEKFSS